MAVDGLSIEEYLDARAPRLLRIAYLLTHDVHADPARGAAGAGEAAG